jgi:hypothetical protein
MNGTYERGAQMIYAFPLFESPRLGEASKWVGRRISGIRTFPSSLAAGPYGLPGWFTRRVNPSTVYRP